MQGGLGAHVEEIARPEVVRIGLDVVGRRLLDDLLLLRQQFDLELIDDRMSDLILKGENVGQVSVIAIGPQMYAILAVDELASYAHPLASLPDASFEYEFDAKLLSCLLHLDGFALVGEDRIAGDDRKPRNLR